MSEIRILPLPKVTGIWEHDCSRYPDTIRVPMSDGKVISYRIDVEMPHPSLLAALEDLERFQSGYKKSGR